MPRPNKEARKRRMGVGGQWADVPVEFEGGGAGVAAVGPKGLVRRVTGVLR